MSESSHAKSKTPLLGDKTYAALKYTATIVLPALGALYFALAQIWGLPKAEEVVGTIAAVNTFVGVIVGISTVSYNNSTVAYDGTIQLDGNQMAKIQLHHESPTSFVNKPVAILKIENGE
ncbi:holin [Streptomyces phage Psst1]|nr:holin [Streptomyces phage Psst1]WPJ30724.1 holin [Streptomyces phage Psst2]